MAKKVDTETLEEKFLGKQVTILGTEEGDIDGEVTVVESDGTLEVTTAEGEEYIINPEDFKIKIHETKETEEVSDDPDEVDEVPDEVDDPPVLTAKDIRKIEDKGILKKLIKENGLKPSLVTYKTIEAMQDFLIENLCSKTEKAEEKKSVKKAEEKPEKASEKKKAGPDAQEPETKRRRTVPEKPEKEKIKKEKKERKSKEGSITEFVCAEIRKGDLDFESLEAKTKKAFPNSGKNASYGILRVAKLVLGK